MNLRGIVGMGLAVGLTTALAACSDKEASQEAQRWYKPWFGQAGGEAEADEAAPATSEEAASDEAEPTEASDLPEGEEVAGEPALGAEPGAAKPALEEESHEARLVTIKVKRGETVQAYAKWSGVPEEDLRTLNKVEGKKGLRIGAPFQLMLDPPTYRKFEQAREEQLDKLEKDFFGRFEVVRLAKYAVKKGDNVWTVSKLHDNVPVWLIEKFNATTDMNALAVGSEVLVPVIQELALPGATAAGQLFPDGKAPPAVPVAAAPIVADKAVKPVAAPKPAAPPEPAFRGLVVQVARKETFGLYSAWAGVKIADIQIANPGVSSSRLVVGQKIRVPVPDKRMADFYRERRKFNGTPPPADVAPLREPPTVAAARPPRAGQPTREPAKPAFRQHKVARGENAWVLATKRYKIPLTELKRMNPGKDLEALKVGDVIQVPAKASRPGGPRSVHTPVIRRHH